MSIYKVRFIHWISYYQDAIQYSRRIPFNAFGEIFAKANDPNTFIFG